MHMSTAVNEIMQILIMHEVQYYTCRINKMYINTYIYILDIIYIYNIYTSKCLWIVHISCTCHRAIECRIE